jgi:hypothetical protein
MFGNIVLQMIKSYLTFENLIKQIIHKQCFVKDNQSEKQRNLGNEKYYHSIADADSNVDILMMYILHVLDYLDIYNYYLNYS